MITIYLQKTPEWYSHDNTYIGLVKVQYDKTCTSVEMHTSTFLSLTLTPIQSVHVLGFAVFNAVE